MLRKMNKNFRKHKVNNKLDSQIDKKDNSAEIDEDFEEFSELGIETVVNKSSRNLFTIEEKVNRDEDFEVKFQSYTTPLEDGDYDGCINKIEATKESGKYGVWSRLAFKIQINNTKNLENKSEEIYYICSNSLKSNNRLFNIVKAALGNIPTGSFNVREILLDKDVKVKIKREPDEYGNVFASVDKFIC
jgi:hypothetical protein